MLKFILSSLTRTNASHGRPADEDALRWVRDPLSHPSLEVMSERQLGDLPFRR